jgi:hypothetical protein
MSSLQALAQAAGTAEFEPLLLAHLRSEHGDLQGIVGDDGYVENVEFTLPQPHQREGHLATAQVLAKYTYTQQVDCCSLPRPETNECTLSITLDTSCAQLDIRLDYILPTADGDYY